MKQVGKRNYQAAVMVYKDDETAKSAWVDVKKIHKEHGGICGELHDNKDEFLDAIKEWSSSIDRDNGFLCIYAHMGAAGIGCTHTDCKRVITWGELADALGNGVELIWLVGCNSKECLKKWDPLSGPVRHMLLATSKSKYWGPLLECFAAEIDIKRIRFYDEMPKYLKDAEPKLGEHTTYYRPGSSGFKKAFK